LLTLREERKLRVFENRALRRIFRPRRVEVTGESRKLHKEEFNDLYSPNILGVITTRSIRWAGDVARMGKKIGLYLKERDHLGDPGVDGRTILRWIFRNWIVGVWTGGHLLMRV
jgi:hypothetical protein